jgi:hypothetical protein
MISTCRQKSVTLLVLSSPYEPFANVLYYSKATEFAKCDQHNLGAIMFVNTARLTLRHRRFLHPVSSNDQPPAISPKLDTLFTSGAASFLIDF